MPRNPLIAEPLFRVQYVEKAGTGTTDMIADCRAAGLPEPGFKQCGPHFVTTLWRDWLTEEVMTRLELSDRQQQAIRQVKIAGKITNQDLRDLTGVVIRTASRDLEDLVKRGVLQKVGTTGRGTYYVLAQKLDTNRTNRT
jgi:ATP-dependent DNA helicase RecG